MIGYNDTCLTSLQMLPAPHLNVYSKQLSQLIDKSGHIAAYSKKS